MPIDGSNCNLRRLSSHLTIDWFENGVPSKDGACGKRRGLEYTQFCCGEASKCNKTRIKPRNSCEIAHLVGSGQF